MMDLSKKAKINGIFLLVTLVTNAMGAFGWISGLTQKDISDMYVTLITPAPATFSIWSVIYSLLIISIIVMIVKKDDLYYKSAVGEVSTLFRISCVLNIAWIVSFSFIWLGVSTILIFALVITLSLISQKLYKIQQKNRLLLPLTFGLYTGWLFIATVVNVAAWLVKLEWGGFGLPYEVWAGIILIVAVFLTLTVLLQTRNSVFPLPIAWAYFGIYNFLVSPEGFQGRHGFLQIIALIGLVALVGIAAMQLYRNHYEILPIHSSDQH